MDKNSYLKQLKENRDQRNDKSSKSRANSKS